MRYKPMSGWAEVMRDLLASDEGEWNPYRVLTSSPTKTAIRSVAAAASLRHLRPRGFALTLRILSEPDGEGVDVMACKARRAGEEPLDSRESVEERARRLGKDAERSKEERIARLRDRR